MSRPVLIVGGAGYIGAHVNCELAGDGYETVVLDNLSQGHREFVQWGEFRFGDVMDRVAMRQLFEEHRFETVMHFAGLINVGDSVTHPLEYYRNNVGGVINLLEVMAEFDATQLVFSSTCAVYGMPQRLPLTENHPESPMNPYGWTKLFCERVIRDAAAAHNIRFVLLRYFNAAGADPAVRIGEWHRPETHLIPLVLGALTPTGNPVRVFGNDYDTADGTCVRDYVHVVDLARAHVDAMLYLSSGGANVALNIGSDRGYSVRDVLLSAEKTVGRPVPFIDCPRRPGDPPILVSDSEKARNVLGWRPKFGELDAIMETAWRWQERLERELLAVERAP